MKKDPKSAPSQLSCHVRLIQPAMDMDWGCFLHVTTTDPTFKSKERLVRKEEFWWNTTTGHHGPFAGGEWSEREGNGGGRWRSSDPLVLPGTQPGMVSGCRCVTKLGLWKRGGIGPPLRKGGTGEESVCLSVFLSVLFISSVRLPPFSFLYLVAFSAINYLMDSHCLPFFSPSRLKKRDLSAPPPGLTI